jgi:hypothetical protein
MKTIETQTGCAGLGCRQRRRINDELDTDPAIRLESTVA